MLELDKVYNEDCLDVLKRLPDECIDLLVTDCPYRIVQGGCTTIPRNDEPKGIFNRRNTFTQDTAKSGKLFKHNDIEFEEWLPEVYRVMKQNTHSYIMINARNLKELQVECEKVGFEFQQLLVWEKGNATPNRYYLNASLLPVFALQKPLPFVLASPKSSRSPRLHQKPPPPATLDIFQSFCLCLPSKPSL